MKKDREIMHNDKKDSELIAEYYDKYEQKLYRLSYAVLGDIWQGGGGEKKKIDGYSKWDDVKTEVGKCFVAATDDLDNASWIDLGKIKEIKRLCAVCRGMTIPRNLQTTSCGVMPIHR